MKKIYLLISLAALLCAHYNGFSQCSTGYVFTYNGKSYEIVSQNKTWTAAAACAAAKGGYLAEINDASEQAALFAALTSLNIDPANTTASDGFSSYVWIGGNDLSSEGNWVWNGNNDAATIPFWIGNASGTLIFGQYSNWGFEPDNWLGAGPLGQDGLGMSLINWQNGEAGEWNDINHNNALYYVIEYNALLSRITEDKNTSVGIFPNPVQNTISVYNNSSFKIEKMVLLNSIGQEIKIFQAEHASTSDHDVSNLQTGIYFLLLYFEDGTSMIHKIIKK